MAHNLGMSAIWRFHFLRSMAFVAMLLVVGACAPTSASSTWTFVPAGPTPSGAPTAGASLPAIPTPAGSTATGSGAPGSPAASGSAGQVIALEETGTLSITQDGQPVSSLALKKGVTYTFRITNSAGFPHDFYIGSPDALSGNQTSGLPGIAQFSSGTQEFQYTVTDQTASLQFGCTLPGHYPTMHGTFTVQP
jgi:uncharacterized cupredoxin-like copper-binding protein